MKKFIYSILLSIFILFPVNVLALGNISASPSSLSIEVGSSKTFTISAYNAIGDVSIRSNNSSIASVSTSSWSTGMVGEKETKTGTITVTGNSVGSTTIILTLDAATFDEEDLSLQTRVINVNVVAKPTTTTATTTTTIVTTTTKPITTTKNNTTKNTTINKTTKNNTMNKTTKNNTKKNTTTKAKQKDTTTKKKDSNNANLKTIIINNENIDFKEDKDVYDITVSNDTNVLDIKAETFNSNASFKIDGDTNLKEGLNVIKIVTLSEDKSSTKTYTLNITRKEKEAKLSSNTYIKSINIKNYKINFNKDIKEYELTIKDENSLDITVILEDTLSSYKITGNSNLKDKSIIKILVTAEDGKTDAYYLNINKRSNNNIIVFISIFLVIIGLGLIIFFIKKNKDKKNNDKLSDTKELSNIINETKNNDDDEITFHNNDELN